MRRLQLSVLAIAVAGLFAAPGAANATLTLTAAGIAEGFTLSTFADNFPTTGFCCGPLGIAFPTSGGVMVADYPGNVRVFPTDTDGQHANLVAPGAFYGSGNGVGLAKLGGNIYMTEQSAGHVVQLKDNGIFNHNVVDIGGATGIVADTVHGFLYVDGAGGIWKVDTTANTKTLFLGVGADGLTTDGTTLFAAVGGGIIGYSLADTSTTFAFISISGADGTALGSGTLAGKLFVNTNDGRVVEVDIAGHTQHDIATGGSRGDFVTVDPNGTLLVTQTDTIMRLSPPAGGGFQGQAPEPATMALLGFGLAGLGVLRRRR